MAVCASIWRTQAYILGPRAVRRLRCLTVKSKNQLGCAAHHRICRPLSGGAQLQAEANRERIQIGKKIGVLKRQSDNIVIAIADGVATSSNEVPAA